MFPVTRHPGPLHMARALRRQVGKPKLWSAWSGFNIRIFVSRRHIANTKGSLTARNTKRFGPIVVAVSCLAISLQFQPLLPWSFWGGTAVGSSFIATGTSPSGKCCPSSPPRPARRTFGEVANTINGDVWQGCEELSWKRPCSWMQNITTLFFLGETGTTRCTAIKPAMDAVDHVPALITIFPFMNSGTQIPYSSTIFHEHRDHFYFLHRSSFGSLFILRYHT